MREVVVVGDRVDEHAVDLEEDLIRVVGQVAFSKAEFARRQRVEVDGTLVWLATPEDVILAKLEWAKASGSERQIRDAAGIVAVQGEGLDSAWLRRWAKELDVEDLLRRVYPEAP